MKSIKKRIISLIVNLHYMQKLFLSSLLLIFIPFILYLSITSFVTMKTENAKAIASYRQGLNQSTAFLGYKAKAVKNIVDAISADPTISTLSDKDPSNYTTSSTGIDTTGNWQIDNGAIMNILYNTYSNGDISEVSLYMAEGPASSQETEQIQSLKSIQYDYWYNALLRNRSNYEWFPASSINEEQNQDTLSFVRKVPNRDNLNQVLCVLKADVPNSIFDEILNESVFTDQTLAVLINSSHDIIAKAGNTSLLNNSSTLYIMNSFQYNPEIFTLQEKTRDGRKYLVGVKAISQTDWMLELIVPQKDIIQVTTKARNNLLIIFLFILPLAIPPSYLMAKYNTKRLNKLIAQMKSVETGNFDIKILPSSQDEIGQLTQNFNHMITKTSILLDETYMMGKEIKGLELKALQEQINPHFLYNTLDQIHWMALQSGATEIMDLVSHLANFYKLSLSNGNTIVTVKNELDHVRAYVSIQNMRFDDSIRLIIDVPEEMMEYPILKTTLQPLVENAIVHGIREKADETGTIRISGSISETAELTVTDDGVGMDARQIAGLLEEEFGQKTSGYGIKNINTRLQLSFGNMYGLVFESEKGVGTKVTVRFPAAEKRQNPSAFPERN